MIRVKRLYLGAPICGLVLLNACGLFHRENVAEGGGVCAPTQLSQVAGSIGSADVFMMDPIASSGNPQLSPNSSPLDEYATAVGLSRLSGLGVLDGQFVSIRNRVHCSDHFGAYNAKNQFQYPHSDFRFQEAMSYYFGDEYQNRLKNNGYLVSRDPTVIIAHCETVDNSYFTKAHDTSGQIYNGREFNEVCLGDSKSSPGAFYADDAQVVIHELQHAATVDNYSAITNLNQFFYDEAGSLNEGISDFMSLGFADNLSPSSPGLDSRIFSRWALGTFNPKPNHNSVRGAHRCPMYDSKFSDNCSSYPNFALPSDSNNYTTTVSFIYPDGLGWPFPDNFKSQNVLSNIYQSYAYNQEIHNNALIVTGALWDVYSALKKLRSGDGWTAFDLTQKLVMEGVRHLPTPTRQNRSPVTFIQFANKLVDSIALVPELSATDRAAVVQALKERGLFQSATLRSETWVTEGPGIFKLRPYTPTPGVFIQDNPQVLAKWLTQMGIDSGVVGQGLSSGLNSMLDPGEFGVIWFDLQNEDDLTAGGILVSVVSSDSDVEILDDSFNVGFSMSEGTRKAQIMYSKVNGKIIAGILAPLSGASLDQSSYFSTSGNTYFTTDLLFALSYRTGIWVKVNPNAEHGKVVEFQVQAVPANASGTAQSQPVTLRFPVVIN